MLILCSFSWLNSFHIQSNTCYFIKYSNYLRIHFSIGVTFSKFPFVAFLGPFVDLLNSFKTIQRCERQCPYYGMIIKKRFCWSFRRSYGCQRPHFWIDLEDLWRAICWRSYLYHLYPFKFWLIFTLVVLQ
jgi:hypothetical protein